MSNISATSGAGKESAPGCATCSGLKGTIACWTAVAVIIVGHWLAGFSATLDKSLTYDEGAHLFSGVVYWLRGDFRFQCENGNLPQRWCAIPSVLSGQTRLPDSKLPFWKDAQPREGGNCYLYDCGNDAVWTIRTGRAWCGLWGLAICLAVFLWSRHLFGIRGAFVSLVSCAACPTLLANAPLMTSDTCLTLFLLLSVAAIWHVLHRVNCWTVSLAALALSGLFLSKTSAILIFPMAALLVAVRLRSTTPLTVEWLGSRWETKGLSAKLTSIFGAAALCGILVWGAVWAAYDFRFTPNEPSASPTVEYLRFGKLERVCSELPPRQASIIRGLAQAKLLPEPFLYGAAYVAAHRERIAFLNGKYSLGGFREYFPYTFLVKTPLAMLGLLAAAAVAMRRSSKELSSAWWYPYAPLLTLVGVYLTAAIFSGLNIGHRHILPIYPALHILVGAAGSWLSHGWRGKVTVGTLLTTLVLEASLAWPHHLAFFNPIVRPGSAHQHLVESSLDWGQDLPGLGRWLKENNSAGVPVFLAYFGVDRADAYGIRAIQIPGAAEAAKNQPLPLSAGLYCVSATTLQGVYTSRPGPWSKKHEEAYQQLQSQPSKSPTPEQIRSLERARFLRLLAFLRHQNPVANIGGSILIFRLTEADVHTALQGPPAEFVPLPLIEQLKAQQGRSRL